MYDNPINPNHDPRKPWTQIPKFKQHYDEHDRRHRSR